MGKRQVTGRFYRIFFHQGRGYRYAAVEAPSELSRHDMRSKLKGYVGDWTLINFTKRKDEGELSDFLKSDVCQKLCSPKLKQIIDKNLTSKDMVIQWLPVTITIEETREVRDYFILHFPESCDSLDEEETVFDKQGTVMRPCFSLKKIEGRSLVNCPNSRFLFLMSRNLKRAISNAGCTGLKFEQTIVLEEFEETSSSDKITHL